MQLPTKSDQQVNVKDIYALKIKALWKGFWQEHASFWFLCLYFFFEYVRPQSIYPAIDVIPWTMLVMSLTLVSAFTNKSITWVSNPINKLLILFAVVIILSGIFAFNPSASWDYKEAMLGWLIVYFLAINIVNTEKQFALFIILYLLYNLKMAQFGARNWVQRGFSFADYGLTGTPGWFHNSGEYAIQMLIYGSLAIAFVISLRGSWGKTKKWVLYIAASLGYLAVMGASSRGSQLALAVISIWFLLKQKNGFKGVLVLSVLAIVLYSLLPEEQVERFRIIGEDRSSLQRLAYWKAGIEIIKEHPVLGVGYNNWGQYMWYKYPNGVGPGQTVQASHNIFIQGGTEMGLLGLFFFILLIIYAFMNNSRTRRMAKELDNKLFFNLSYGLDAGLIGYLVAGFFVTVLYYPFFWVQIAMIVMLNTVTQNNLNQKIKTKIQVQNDIENSSRRK